MIHFVVTPTFRGAYFIAQEKGWRPREWKHVRSSFDVYGRIPAEPFEIVVRTQGGFLSDDQLEAIAYLDQRSKLQHG